jgi:CBS domain-containing protein
MVKNDIGSLLVINKGMPVGIVTERDFTRRGLRSLKDRSVYDTPVSNIMHKKLVTAKPDTPVWDAFELMLKHKIRRLPIIDNDKLVGIVTERDLFKWAVRVTYEPNIPEKIKRLVET